VIAAKIFPLADECLDGHVRRAAASRTSNRLYGS